MPKRLIREPFAGTYKVLPRNTISIGKEIVSVTFEEYERFIRNPEEYKKHYLESKMPKSLTETQNLTQNTSQNPTQIQNQNQNQNPVQSQKELKDSLKDAELKPLTSKPKKQTTKALIIAPNYRDVKRDFADQARQICALFNVNYEVIPLLGDNATGKNIIEEFKKLAKEDGFVVYFLGLSMWYEELERGSNEIIVSSDDMIISWEDVKDLFDRNCTIIINGDTEARVSPIRPTLTKFIHKPSTFSFVDFCKRYNDRFQLPEILTLLRASF